MSLPPGFLDELKSRSSLAQVVGRRVSWDRRKSNPARGDLWAPCPFHQEKTASFHVDDRKGYYHCFGCQAGGDVVKFVQETENLGFMEAVEQLAREAGMAMPAPDPASKERADRAGDLAAVMEAAVKFFALQRVSGAGEAARSYLARRGLGEAALARFEIGFAPASRRALWDHLAGRGLRADLIVESGMAIAPEDGGAPFDRFRDRIMFPIRDARGRCIAFGGRAMAPDARAKYLNSPDTPLFDKGQVLYNHGPAREAAGKGASLIVAEGYMDVIALVEADFGAAVAPLGTAVTAAQLEALWRIAPEPVVALDGDRAGLKAAMRLVDVAMPLLKAGRGLRFALLPGGQDPDELIRGGGAAAMQAALDAAEPMVQLLWRRETEGRTFDDPDRRAALEGRLTELTERITDPLVKAHYRRALKDLQWQAFRPAPGAAAARRPAQGGPSPAARGSVLATGEAAAVETELREAVILAAAIATPGVLDRCAEAIAVMPLSLPAHREIRAALMAWHLRRSGEAKAHVVAAVGADRLETLFRRTHLALVPALRAPGDIDLAEICVTEEMEKLAARRGLESEIRETTEAIPGFADDGVRMKWRLSQATEARNRAERRDLDDDSDFETGPNGAKMNRGERSALDRLIRDIGIESRADSGEAGDEG